MVEGVHKLTAADLAKFFDKKLDDFRNKKIFDFGFNDPTQIEIKDGAKTVSVEKVRRKLDLQRKDHGLRVGAGADRQAAGSVGDEAGGHRIHHAGDGDDRGVGTAANAPRKSKIAPAGRISWRAGKTIQPCINWMPCVVDELRTAAGDMKEQPPQPPEKKK